MDVLICFDIADDRMRSRVVKVLLGCGVRVQKSVFECRFRDRRQFARTRERLAASIDHEVDSVRYYPLCGGCKNGIEWSGAGEGFALDAVTVV